ncbi:hypothetical protein [Amycolatopsis sp. lyj-112]|uniref:hypothetical protein n=1 Tax=Amycolatopsis sp. lyj-112 TaxID=2789288 RepID=UPI00397A5924
MSHGWDFAKTEPASAGDIPPQATSAPAGDPADLAGNLIDELGTRAYRVIPAATVIDHDIRQISIAESIWNDHPTTVGRALIPRPRLRPGHRARSRARNGG